ncbi:MAG: hypothetical protein KME64_42105 [Scytonematopsis contorta HA4267-MV1]|nr:hypothetical protein [Scytonematopsis contorta HA4267-MV1]
MNTTKIYTCVCYYNSILVVFFSEPQCWQFRVISPEGYVFGESKIYSTPVAAHKAGRDWLKQSIK